MNFARIAFAGLALFAFASLPGCGDGGGGAAEVDLSQPDAGLEASKKIMEMRPPPPPGAKKAGRH